MNFALTPDDGRVAQEGGCMIFWSNLSQQEGERLIRFLAFSAGRLCICYRPKDREAVACDTCLIEADSLRKKGWQQT